MWTYRYLILKMMIMPFCLGWQWSQQMFCVDIAGSELSYHSCQGVSPVFLICYCLEFLATFILTRTVHADDVQLTNHPQNTQSFKTV